MALTRFDALTREIAAEGGILDGHLKAALDESLSLYAEACRRLKLDARQDHTSRVVTHRSS